MDDKDIERFWSKVDKSGEHWMWTAGCSPVGYGRFALKGKMIDAHIVSFFLKAGRWPAPSPQGYGKAIIRHACDIEACVRFKHLIEGEYSDNANDREERLRGRWTKTN